MTAGTGRRRACPGGKDPSRTYQSLLILAAFRPWGGSQDSYRARGLATQSNDFAAPAGAASTEVAQ